MTLGMRLIKHALAAVATLVVATGAAMAVPLDFRQLNLINDWERYSDQTRTAAVALSSEGIVYLRGGMKHQIGEVSIYPFVMPKAYRPRRIVVARIGLVGGRAGLLIIKPNGEVYIDPAGTMQDARYFTSLEGVSYPKD
jgi:hypothetical protein